MTALEPLCHLMGIKNFALTKKEKFLIEAELFFQICEELTQIIHQNCEKYVESIKFDAYKEDAMFSDLAFFIINDILFSKEYSLEGIAFYTETNLEIIEEIMMKHHSNSSAMLLRRLIDLHRSARSDLYNSIIKKITAKFILAHRGD